MATPCMRNAKPSHLARVEWGLVNHPISETPTFGL